MTRKNFDDPNLPIKFSEAGGSAGGTVGCNDDIHSWIFGVENDLSEYPHADFGSSRYFSTPTNLGASTVATRDIALKDDLVRAGLNWRFASLP